MTRALALAGSVVGLVGVLTAASILWLFPEVTSIAVPPTAAQATAVHATAVHAASPPPAAGAQASASTALPAASVSPAPPTHWAYQPLRRPPVPSTGHDPWSRSPLDRFWLESFRRAIHSSDPAGNSPAGKDPAGGDPADSDLARTKVALTKAVGIAPTVPEVRDAEPRMVARRLALALTGLPIDRDWLDDFLTETAMGERPDAVERLVDRLIGSPAFGERLASPWLDLARYADTHGYHADSQREMWRWRDWVVNAFNRGLAYDAFLTEQLAGDLLPDASLDQQVATGFLRNHMIIWENGVFDEEYRVEYVMDRVATFSTVVLGQTLACARCHDHKHDPFSQIDFYRLFAFFNNVPEKGVDGEHGNAAPVIAAPTAWQQEQLEQLDARIAATQRQLDERLAARDAGRTDPSQIAWERTARPDGPAAPRDGWLRLDFSSDDPAAPLANRADPAIMVRIQGSPGTLTGPRGAALLLDGESWLEIPPPKREATNGWSFGAMVFPTVDAPLTIASRVSTFNPRRGWSLRLEQRRLTLRVYGPADDQEWAVQSRDPLPLRQWRPIAVVLDARNASVPARLFVDGRPVDGVPVPINADRDQGKPDEAFRATATLRLGRLGDDDLFRGGLDEIWQFDRPLAADEVQALGGIDPLAEWLAVPAAERSRASLQSIRRRFLAATDPEFRSAESLLRETLGERERLRRNLPSAMVMRELPAPRPAFVLHRGRFDEPRERVAADVPRWLTPAHTAPVRDRLALARWATRDDQPLTSRVAVNRFYRDLFGEPLVATPDDFGLRGAAPSIPRLLDWLASEFQGDAASGRGRWDVKRLHRLMATSSVFRRQGPLSVDTALPAETVRDQTLALAGLLDRRRGGPGVFPPQPAGLWEELAYDTQQFTAQTYRPSEGGDRYRRSLYTFWKRAAPPPTLAAFDAPDREVCVAARPPSHSPQQALILMNEPQWLEAARRLADRVARRTNGAPSRALAELFEEVLARPPSAAEFRTLEAAFASERLTFERDPATAAKLLDEPASDDAAGAEAAVSISADQAARAALVCVAHVLLSLEETVTLP